jgi:hypothetical protein
LCFLCERFAPMPIVYIGIICLFYHLIYIHFV